MLQLHVAKDDVGKVIGRRRPDRPPCARSFAQEGRRARAMRVLVEIVD
jgi:predicted RNA-binding protein YlqC (UPF0109 family)